MSTCSRVEKNVERSGRRDGWAALSLDGGGTLCSAEEFSRVVKEGLKSKKYLRTKPFWRYGEMGKRQ